MLWWCTTCAIAVLVFNRGLHLLGFGTGVMFALITFAIAMIGYHNVIAKPFSLWRIAAFVIFAIACGAIMLSPTTFSPELQHFVDKHATDRDAHSELKQLFGANPNYDDLTYSTAHAKLVNVRISGTIPTQATLPILLDDLSRTDAARRCLIGGRVVARDSDTGYTFDYHDLADLKAQDDG